MYATLLILSILHNRPKGINMDPNIYSIQPTYISVISFSVKSVNISISFFLL